MPGKLGADLVVTQKHKRLFLQWGGAFPNNVVTYGGQDDQNVRISGVSHPIRGAVNPIRVPDPNSPGKFKIVGHSEAARDMDGATLAALERHGAIPRLLGRDQCAVNIYEMTGPCKNLSDFGSGWSDYVLIYSGGLITTVNLGDRTGWDSDAQAEDTATLTLDDLYGIGTIGFGEQATTQVDLEVVDLTYFSTEQCGECGLSNNGVQWLYAVVKSSGGGSPGLPSELVYSLDGGLTWHQTNITTMSALDNPSAVEVVGDKIIVVVPGDTGYHWATINTTTGIPGTWTKVTTGFVAGKAPRDVFALSPREVYFVGNGGYIYRSLDVTAGVSVLSAGAATASDLHYVHGTEECLVATGVSGALVYSINRGATWSTPAAVPVVLNTINCVAVLDSKHWWVGTSSGRVYYTINGGASWTELGLSGAGAGQVRDIVFATAEVGYVAIHNGTPTASIWTTWNGGANWTNTTPRLLGLPTFDYANRIAVPRVSNSQVAANNIALGGLGANHTDGIILIGVANIV